MALTPNDSHFGLENSEARRAGNSGAGCAIVFSRGAALCDTLIRLRALKRDGYAEDAFCKFIGICFMNLNMFLFSALATMEKFLSDGIHQIQIVWFRQLRLLCGVVVCCCYTVRLF